MIRALYVTVALASACKQASPPETRDPVHSEPRPAPEDTPMTKPDVTMPAPADIAPLAQASNAFAFDLWRKTSTQPGNVAMSPASLSTALAMTWGGAKGETAAEMKRAMHLTGDADAVMAAWGKLASALQSPSRKLELRIANRLFGEQTYKFEQAYLDKTKAAYGAPLEPVDFRHAAEAGRTRINKWVADQTNQRITNLLPPPSITDQTRLVLVNALYFLADWAQAFEPRATNPAPFLKAGGKTDVPTMHAMSTFRFAKADGVSVLELPYQGGDAAMVVVLPDQVDGVTSIENSLDASKLAAWQAALQPQQVAVALPRFTIDPAEPVELSNTLIALGMASAFDRKRADFTAMAAPRNPEDELFISAVFHKAFVKVDEKGTEAAAASAVVMAPRGAPPRPAAEFKADHPFLFFIVDKASGLILFVGRVVDPSAK